MDRNSGSQHAMAENGVLMVQDVAELLRVDAKTIYRKVKRRELPGFKVPESWRFKEADIGTWIESQKGRS